MKCNKCGLSMALVLTENGRPWSNVRPGTKCVEKGYVCACKNYCVTGDMHGDPIWWPALTLVPSDSSVHAAIWGAINLLKHYKPKPTGKPA